jgi:hypothetical protein
MTAGLCFSANPLTQTRPHQVPEEVIRQEKSSLVI